MSKWCRNVIFDVIKTVLLRSAQCARWEVQQPHQAATAMCQLQVDPTMEEPIIRSIPEWKSLPAATAEGNTLLTFKSRLAGPSHRPVEGEGSAGVRVRLLPFGAILNSRSPSCLISKGMSGR